MSRKILQFSALLLLSLMSVSAFADSTITATAVTQHTDLSLAFLSQVFGTVGHSLQGTSGQMLGQLFYKFNQGILAVAGIWLAYLTLTTLVRTAHEGSFVNSNRNIVLIMLRVVVGFGLLLPNPATGYSIFQDVLMKVVVGGVSLADNTWNYGLKYLDNGGQVWKDPDAQGNSQIMDPTTAGQILGKTSFGGRAPTYADLAAVQKIFLDEVCMYSANQYKQDNNLPTSDVQYMPDQKAFYFPGLDNSTQGPYAAVDCGTATLAMPNASAESVQTQRQATLALINAIKPVAQNYACINYNDPNNQSACSSSAPDLKSDAGQAFYSSLMNYANLVQPLTMPATSGPTSKTSFIQQAEREGWMMAGRYYWDLSQVQNNAAATQSIVTYLPTFQKPGLLQNNFNKNITTTLNSAFNDTPGYTQTASILYANYAAAASAGDASAYTPGNGSIGDIPGMMGTLMASYTGSLSDLVNSFTQGSANFSYNPVVFLHNIGMQSIGVAGAIWFSTSIAITLLSTVTILCQCTINASTIVNNIIGWIKPLMMGIATVMLGIGILLGYYVPLYPFVIFMFGVIGWIIRVMVGMAAAPLVCLSLTHPEGHDFMGVAEQMLMLLLSIFIEPVLMVMGLFAGMILSYVGFKIVIFGFSGFMSDLFAPTLAATAHSLATSPLGGAQIAYQSIQQGIGGGALLIGLSVPMFLVIFAAMVYVITNKCFGVIYELPNEIMHWIGGPQLQNSSEQMSQMVQSIASSAGQSLASAATQTGADTKAIDRKRKPKDDDKKLQLDKLKRDKEKEKKEKEEKEKKEKEEKEKKDKKNKKLRNRFRRNPRRDQHGNLIGNDGVEMNDFGNIPNTLGDDND